MHKKIIQGKELLWAETISGSFMEKVRVEFDLEGTLLMSATRSPEGRFRCEDEGWMTREVRGRGRSRVGYNYLLSPITVYHLLF